VAAAIFPRLLAPKKAFELLLSGDTIKAPEARELGLVNQVLPVEGFEEAAGKWLAEKLATNSAVVLKYTKRAVIEGAEKNYDEAIKAIEELYLNQLMKTIDAKEGLSAFLEKRTPEWKDE
jgi:cyclohexa-1,5-dienecarbonyl-CoA hydratase